MTFKIGDMVKLDPRSDVSPENFTRVTGGLDHHRKHEVVAVSHDGDPDADDDTLIQLKGMPTKIHLGPSVLIKV